MGEKEDYARLKTREIKVLQRNKSMHEECIKDIDSQIKKIKGAIFGILKKD